MSASRLLVISPLKVDDKPLAVSEGEQLLDKLDEFNHPRERRVLILQQMMQRRQQASLDMEFVCCDNDDDDNKDKDWTKVYQKVHTEGLLTFLSTAWEHWQSSGQDPIGGRDSTVGLVLVPICTPLPRDPCPQRASNHVIGQVGYYCTDVYTPIFGALKPELQADAAAVQQAVTQAVTGKYRAVYVLPTHPGHHASADAFGGYCYVNHVAAAARALQDQLATDGELVRVAILDVDYHAGNGTASIFYEDASVLVVSLHCDPNFDYPFHAGFADQTGHGAGEGTTLHLPMPPGTTWESEYQAVLRKGLEAIRQFTPGAVVVSLGLDTYHEDPCALRRAGFSLQDKDYKAMGRMIAEEMPPQVPTVFVQEGGYRMDKVGEAAANVVTSFCQHRSVA